jgi:hypothetical protein
MEVCPATKYLISEVTAVESGKDVVQFFVHNDKQKPCLECFTPSYFQTRNDSWCVKCWSKKYTIVMKKDDKEFLVLKNGKQVLIEL